MVESLESVVQNGHGKERERENSIKQFALEIHKALLKGHHSMKSAYSGTDHYDEHDTGRTEEVMRGSIGEETWETVPVIEPAGDTKIYHITERFSSKKAYQLYKKVPEQLKEDVFLELILGKVIDWEDCFTSGNPHEYDGYNKINMMKTVMVGIRERNKYENVKSSVN